MINVNLEICRAIAVQHGLPLQFVVKEFQAFDVLRQVTEIAGHSTGFVFKGGTALNKVYLGKLQRFSEDLDFDMATGSIGELVERCKEIKEKILGYETEKLRRIKDTIQFYCNYDSLLEGRDHIRVDIAAKKIISAKPPAMKPAVSEYAQMSVFGFYVYSIEDLVARKLCALRGRAEGKDFYDIHNALPLCGRMQGAIEKMTESELLSETPQEFILKTIEKAKKVDYRKLRNLTNPFIPMANRPKDWLELKNSLVLKLEGLK